MLGWSRSCYPKDGEIDQSRDCNGTHEEKVRKESFFKKKDLIMRRVFLLNVAYQQSAHGERGTVHDSRFSYLEIAAGHSTRPKCLATLAKF